jgi:hypothetical protein
MMVLRILAYILVIASLLTVSLAAFAGKQVELTQGVDQSAGGGAAYVITTASAIWYLEKQGGGLSSMVDRDGIDWLGFHKEPGSGWKGEYRGFPNAIHRQDGNYFHAMNAGTDPSTSEVEIVADDHVRIAFTSGNAKWRGVWDFFPDRCDFTMVKVSEGYKYWVSMRVCQEARWTLLIFGTPPKIVGGDLLASTLLGIYLRRNGWLLAIKIHPVCSIFCIMRMMTCQTTMLVDPI